MDVPGGDATAPMRAAGVMGSADSTGWADATDSVVGTGMGGVLVLGLGLAGRSSAGVGVADTGVGISAGVSGSDGAFVAAEP